MITDIQYESDAISHDYLSRTGQLFSLDEYDSGVINNNRIGYLPYSFTSDHA